MLARPINGGRQHRTGQHRADQRRTDQRPAGPTPHQPTPRRPRARRRPAARRPPPRRPRHGAQEHRAGDESTPQDRARTPDALALPEQKPRRWGVALATSLASLTIAAALGLSTFVLVQYEINDRQTVRNAAVLSTVQSFMTLYTSPDPHANDYADKVLAWTTGQLAQL